MNNKQATCLDHKLKVSDQEVPIPQFDSSWRLFFYICPACFGALWEEPLPLAQNILIVWGGFPEGSEPCSPSIMDFITPIDWALAVTYQALPSDDEFLSADNRPLPSIAILDLHSHQRPGSFAVNMRLAMREAIPNVEIFHAFDRYGNDFLRGIEFLSKPPDRSWTSDDLDRTKLNALQQAWLGYTAKSRDHHDINNIVGVQILQEAYRAPSGGTVTAAQGALRQMIRWLGFYGGGSRDQSRRTSEGLRYLPARRSGRRWLAADLGHASGQVWPGITALLRHEPVRRPE